jgi:small-conductance mechanosensitive channel
VAPEIPVEQLQEGVRAITWQHALTAVGALLAFALAAKLTGHLIRRSAHTDGRGPAFAISKLVTYFLTFVGVVTALGLLGLPASSLVLTSSALLVGVGFSLQPVARDFVAGIVILVEQKVRKNDFVTFAKTTGTVREIGLRATQLLTPDGVALVVPNHLLVTTEVTNHSHPFRRTRLRVTVPVSAHADADTVDETLTDVAEGHPEVLSDPPPLVRLEAIETWGFQFVVICWVQEAHVIWRVASELRFAITRALGERGIHYPMPELRLHTGHDEDGAYRHAPAPGAES